MGIESSRIAAGRTHDRGSGGRYAGQLALYPAPPGVDYIGEDGSGGYEVKSWPDPVIEGEVKGYIQYGGIGVVTMYVAVDISGTLEWKLVVMGTPFDPFTGKTFNPMKKS